MEMDRGRGFNSRRIRHPRQVATKTKKDSVPHRQRRFEAKGSSIGWFSFLRNMLLTIYGMLYLAMLSTRRFRRVFVCIEFHATKSSLVVPMPFVAVI